VPLNRHATTTCKRYRVGREAASGLGQALGPPPPTRLPIANVHADRRISMCKSNGAGCRKVERLHKTMRTQFFAAADGRHATLAGLQAALSRSLPGTVSSLAVAEEEDGYEQGDDDGVEGECDERVTGDDPAGKGCSDLDV